MAQPRSVEAVTAALERSPLRVIACSGGVDSLLLADIAHEMRPRTTVVAHAVSPAVPPSATERVQQAAAELGWRLELVDCHEFDDADYLANPKNRCYFCKSNLYRELDRLTAASGWRGPEWTVLSGANTDDLGEYRPGLTAAAEYRVRHPYVEAQMAKADIRALARDRRRRWHDLPAAPCLASRLYTGTPVTAEVLRAVDRGENVLRAATGLPVVRCRVKGDEVIVEVAAPAHGRVTAPLLADVLAAMRCDAPALRSITLDDNPYAPGRAFVSLSAPLEVV
ncbi:adenine nucleotide alpha hydrolase [Mycolicibacterium sp. XJ2546]